MHTSALIYLWRAFENGMVAGARILILPQLKVK